jgi:uncharacterized protein (DUF1810 family)
MYNLERFVEAQETHYANALEEIKQGFKSSHWMWFIFPQLDGLGFSYMAKFYGIKCLKEVQEYLDHPILGMRLREISKELLNHKDKTACEILGEIDAMKLKSSMTLFDFVSPNEIFNEVLLMFYNGAKDKKTLHLIGKEKRNDKA